MTSIDGLLPCPFCGGEARRFTIGDDEPNNAGGDVIVCSKCQASSRVEFGRKENLESAWNTRTPAPSLGEVERVLTAIDLIDDRISEAADGDRVVRLGVVEAIDLVATLRAAFATRTPAPSLGEDVVERLLEGARGIFDNCTVVSGVCCCGDDMERHASPMNSGHSPVDSGQYAVEQWLEEARAALSSMRPVQEEGVETVVRQTAPADADYDEHFLTVHVSKDGKLVGINHPCDAVWSDVMAAHVALRDRINERIEAQDGCPFKPRKASHPEASPPSLGVEELRELSEKASKGPWALRPQEYDDWGMIRGAPDEEGRRWIVARAYESNGYFDVRGEEANEHRRNGTDPYEPNAAFIVACVNHVREALSRVSGRSEEDQEVRATADAATCPSSLRSPEPSKDVSAHPGDGQAQERGR